MKKGTIFYLYRRIFTGCQLVATEPALLYYAGCQIEGQPTVYKAELWAYTMAMVDGTQWHDSRDNIKLLGILRVK